MVRVECTAEEQGPIDRAEGLCFFVSLEIEAITKRVDENMKQAT